MVDSVVWHIRLVKVLSCKSIVMCMHGLCLQVRRVIAAKLEKRKQMKSLEKVETIVCRRLVLYIA